VTTTFNVISLGTWSDFDPTEGNGGAENAATLAGHTFGSIDDPLCNHLHVLSAGSYSGGFDSNSSASYDTDNFWATDTFHIDGGSLRTFDSVLPYTATITYADGTTATVSRISIFQDTAGNIYLAPRSEYNSDQVALEAGAIRSITLGTYVTPPGGVGWNMTADRDPWDGIITHDSTVEGTTGNDSMGVGYADGGGDLIDGADGDADTIRSGLGNDTIAAGNGNDVVTAGSGDDSVDLGAGNDTFGDNADWNTEDGNDSVRGGIGNDFILGGGGNDTLHGDGGDDTLSGAWGADLIYGDAGNDSFIVTDGHETDTIDGGTETDTIAFSNYTLTTGVSVTYTGSGAGTWSYSANDHGVFSAIEVISGTGYADTINATADTVGTTIYGNGGADSIIGGAGANTLDGGAGNDTITGGAGADQIWGGAGSDSLTGGADGDTFWIDQTSGTGDTIIGSETGTDADVLSLADTTAQGVSVTFTGSEAGSYTYVSGTASGSFSQIEGFWLSAGADSLNAAAASLSVSVAAGDGNDTLTGGSGADLLAGENGTDSLTGGLGNDTLSGGAGADTLSGGSGNDCLSGGLESDYFLFTNSDGTDTVIGGDENFDYDLLGFSTTDAGVHVTYTGAEAGSWSFTGGGSGSFTQIEGITGTAAADTLDASATTSAVTLAGGAGNDVLSGGSGNDHFNGNDGNDTETGGLGNDTLNGDAGNDSLSGGAGDDWLLGGSGNNTLIGGDGNDYFNAFSGSNSVDGGAGADTILLGDGADTINGGAGADSISAGSGNDRIALTDGFGNDTIDAGETGESLGDTLDGSALTTATTLTYSGAEAGTLASGADTLSFTGVEQATLGAGADSVNATASSTGVNVSSGSGDDTLIGGAGNDTFSGSFGADSIVGGDGGDALAGGSGNDTIDGGTGNDTITAGGENDLVSGGDGDDAISGGTGNDTLDAGAGDDYLTGDTGDNRFIGGTGNDSIDLVSGMGIDTIVLGDGSGSDFVTNFDMTRLTPGGATLDRIDVGDLQTLTNAPVTAKDVVIGADSLGNAVLTFPQGETLTLLGVSASSLTTAPFETLHAMGIPCFVAGSPIETPGGPVAVEDLRVGDLVNVHDGPPQPVLWTASRPVTGAQIRADRRLAPVEIRAGALGNTEPVRLSAQHCVLVPEGAGRLARLHHLAETGFRGVRVMAGKRGCTYHHLLLPRHALLHVGGLWAESFWPGRVGFAALDNAGRRALLAAFPALAPALFGTLPVEAVYSPRARPLLLRRDISHRRCAAWQMALARNGKEFASSSC